jgi:periplasmic divalent cation tolerance protein
VLELGKPHPQEEQTEEQTMASTNSADYDPIYCVVLVTVPNQEVGQTLARRLLEAQLAACINCFPVQSTYVWQGTLQHDSELQLLIKTKRVAFGALAQLIQELHPYEVPEIIALPILTGAASYLSWMDSTISV